MPQLVIFLLFVSAPCWAETNDMNKFILERGCSVQQLKQISEGLKKINACFRTSEYMMCVVKDEFANIQDSPVARNSLVKTTSMKAKYDLYNYIQATYNPLNLKYINAVKLTINRCIERNIDISAIKKIEFVTFCQRNWITAIASIKSKAAYQEIQALYTSPSFIKEYCRTLYPYAIESINKNKLQSALSILKELHDLKYTNVHAYILIAETFYKVGKNKDAKDIAFEVLDKLHQLMSGSEAERLGDLLLRLGCSSEAAKAYDISMQLDANS